MTRSLSVTDWLRENILSGMLPPGERLQEVRLSDMLGVSRTPVRAALHSLAAAGLVDYAPNRGYVVRPFPVSEMIDAFEIRGVIEGLGARFAAERGLDATARAKIETAIARIDDLIAHATTLGRPFFNVFGEANFVIHETILDAADNRMLGDLVHAVCLKPGLSNAAIVEIELDRLKLRHQEHHRIYEAVLAREPALAERLMREHVAGVKIGVVRTLRSKDSDSKDSAESATAAVASA